MSIHTIHLRFRNDGAHLIRCEWGKSRKDAIRTLRGIYGDTFDVIA